MRRVIRGLFYEDPAEKPEATANYERVDVKRFMDPTPSEERVLSYLLDFYGRHAEPPSYAAAHDHFENALLPDETALLEEAAGNQFYTGGSFEDVVEEVAETQANLHMKRRVREALDIYSTGTQLPNGDTVKGHDDAVEHLLNMVQKLPPKGEPTDPAERDAMRAIATAIDWRNLVRSKQPIDEVYFGFLEPGQVHVLSARSNAGKTAFALWIAGHWACGALPAADDKAFALAVATEEEDSKRALAKVVPPPRDRSLAVYLSPEVSERDLARTARRFIDDGAQHLGCDPNEFAVRNFFPVVKDPKEPLRFDAYRLAGSREKPEGWGRIASLVEHFNAESVPSDPKSALPLLVVDTHARMGPRGGREVDNSELTYLVEQLEWVAARTGAAVLVLHHVSQEAHGKGFDQIDPLTYGRGGTGMTAAARCGIALAPPQFGGGSVVGIKRVSNNLPPRGAMYFETCPPGERGIQYFRPLLRDEAAALREAAKDAAKAAKLDLRPGSMEVRRRLWDERGAGPHTTADLKRAIAALWPNEATGRPRGDNSQATREYKDELLAAWAKCGEAEMERTKDGDVSERLFRLTREPPAQEAQPGEASAALDDAA